MSIAMRTYASSPKPLRWGLSYLAGRLLIQLCAMGLALSIGYIRYGHVHDQQLIRECLWLIPLAFAVGNLWYGIRFVREKLLDQTALLRDYSAFSERLWLISFTVFLLLSQLTTA